MNIVKNGLIIVSVVLLMACGSPATPTTQNDAQSSQVAVASSPAPSATVAATNTPLPTSTTQPTATTAPTNTPTPEPTQRTSFDPNDVFALNNLGVQESGGVRLEVLRVVIGKKDVLEQEGINFSDSDIFNDVDVVGEVIFKITNTTQDKVAVYVDQGTVVINDEQIKLIDYSFGGASFGDDIGGDFFPGVTAIGGMWFGIKRAQVADVNRMLINVNAPTNDNFKSLGEEFNFTIDLSSHEYQPLPEDLK